MAETLSRLGRTLRTFNIGRTTFKVAVPGGKPVPINIDNRLRTPEGRFIVAELKVRTTETHMRLAGTETLYVDESFTKESPLTIGNGKDNDISVVDQGIVPEHAELFYDSDQKRFVLRNLPSSKHISVDQGYGRIERVAPGAEFAFNQGTIVFPLTGVANDSKISSSQRRLTIEFIPTRGGDELRALPGYRPEIQQLVPFRVPADGALEIAGREPAALVGFGATDQFKALVAKTMFEQAKKPTDLILVYENNIKMGKKHRMTHLVGAGLSLLAIVLAAISMGISFSGVGVGILALLGLGGNLFSIYNKSEKNVLNNLVKLLMQLPEETTAFVIRGCNSNLAGKILTALGDKNPVKTKAIRALTKEGQPACDHCGKKHD